MSNHGKDSILKFLQQHAPKAPLAECMSIANDFQCLKDAEYYLKMQIALLAEVLEFDENGGIKELVRKYRDDKAILWALDAVSYCHAWVVCGPGRGMEGMKKEIVKDIENGTLKLDVSVMHLKRIKEEEEKREHIICVCKKFSRENEDKNISIKSQKIRESKYIEL